MHAWFALAAKDIRLLLRNRGALFFTVGWPMLVAIFFGLIFGGGGGSSRPKVALVVQEQHAATERFAQSVLKLDTLEVERLDAAKAEEQVRQGKRSAAIVLPEGFGERSARTFSGDPPQIELWLAGAGAGLFLVLVAGWLGVSGMLRQSAMPSLRAAD